MNSEHKVALLKHDRKKEMELHICLRKEENIISRQKNYNQARAWNLSNYTITCEQVQEMLFSLLKYRQIE